MSNARPLLPQLKNRALEILRSADLEPNEFTWELVLSPWDQASSVSRISFPRLGLWFLFVVDDDGIYRPKSYPNLVGSKNPEVSAGLIMNVSQRWVNAVAAEIKAPDLWAMASAQKGIGADPTQANTPFTPAERANLTEGLKQLEAYVYQAEGDQLTPEKEQAVAARFQYFHKTMERLGRLDWTSIVIGQMFAMATEKIITVQTFTALYSMAANLIGQAAALGGTVTKLVGG